VVERLAAEGVPATRTLSDLVSDWSRRGSFGDGAGGAPNGRHHCEARRLLPPRDDVIIDGGNTFYQDDIRRAAALRQEGRSTISMSEPAEASSVSSAAIA